MEYITITISAQTLATLGAGLQELPYKVSKPAIDEIQVQVDKFLEDKKAAEAFADSPK